MIGVQPASPLPFTDFGFSFNARSNCLAIAVAKGVHHPDDGRVRLRRDRLSRQRIRPFSALFDPRFDDVDLCLRQRALRWHLRARLADQPLVDGTRGTVAWDNASAVGADSVWHGVPAPIESQSSHLLGGAVALDAVLPQDRLDITSEVDFRGLLRRGLQARRRHCHRSLKQSTARRARSCESVPSMPARGTRE